LAEGTIVETVAQVIAFVGILVFLSHLFSGIFSKTRIPDVILLILIGICVGPLLGLATPATFGEIGLVFTTITLIILLFEGGLALKLNMLRSALGGVMALAVVSFFLAMGVVAGLTLLLTDLDVIPVFILGAIVGSTSEAVIIPLQQGVAGGDVIKNLTYGIIVFSIVLTSIMVLLLEKTPLANFYVKGLKPLFVRLAAGNKTIEAAPVNKTTAKSK